MEFRILGLLEVTDGEVAVELRGAKLRALLAMLLLHANRVVSMERLVEALWGDDAPPTAATTLQVYVSKLRGALGASHVVTRSPGYVLVADPVSIDASSFERLAIDGRRALDARDAVRAHAALDAALALWRGSALADFPYAAFAQAEAARLEELRRVTIEDRAEAELALGRHGEAVGNLQALVDEHPLRERLWGALMLALYRCGRQAESLRAYQNLRRLLGDELGIEPSPTLRRLEEAILLQAPELDLPATATGDEPGGVPLPGRLVPGTTGLPFVGREDERAVLVEALKEAGADCRRVVLVGGEAGIGKTTLVSEFAGGAHDQGAVILYGRCDEDLGLPYQPWAGAIAHLVDHLRGGPLADVLAAHGANLAHLGPALASLAEGGGGGSSDPETARYLLFATAVEVLQAAGRRQPVVLVLDDLQWADAPSLALLRHLVASEQPMAVLIVATFRDSDVPTNRALADVLAGLHREPGVVRLSLRGLSDSELLELLETGAGQTMDESGLTLRDALARETNGNPFFVGELLRHMVETGSIYRAADGTWALRGDLRQHGLPVSVREVIGRRVARLGEDAVAALSMAAVIGRDFDLATLALASDRAEDALLDVMDAAVAASLVVNVAGEQYSFVHALVEHALYDALTPARRARAHRRAGDAIEAACGADPGPRVGELAYHYAASGRPEDSAKAIRYARAAGDRALAQLAPDEALRWYGQALALLEKEPVDNDRLRCSLLVGVGDAQRQLGTAAFRETLLEAGRLAQRLGDTDALAAAALANTRGDQSSAGQVDAERVAMIETALAAVGTADSQARARLLSLLGLERSWDGDYPRRRAVADEALAIARRIGDSATLLDVLLRRHNTIRIPETLADRVADTSEAEALAAQRGDPIVRFWSANNRMAPAIESADLATVTRCQQEMAALGAEVGQPTLRWIATFARSWGVLLAGEAVAAEALALQALQLGNDTGQPDTLAVYGTQLVCIRWHQGRDGELTDLVIGLAADNPEIPAFRAGLARICTDGGRDDEARQLLAAETAAGFPHPHDHLLLCSLSCWAEAAARVGDRVAAEALYPRLAPWPERVIYTVAGVFGATAHYLGLLAGVLGRHEAAEAHFAQAQAVHERLQAPFHLARTHLEWGRMLAAKDDADGAERARPHLESARELADRYGCALVAHRAGEALRTR